MKMVQMISPSKKLRKVTAFRDLPHESTARSTVNTQTRKIGRDDVAVITKTREKSNSYAENKCVGIAADHNYHRPKEAESIDLILRKAGFNTAGANSNAGNGTVLQGKRKSFPSLTSKVQPLSSEEAIKLMATQSKRRHCYGSNIQSKRPLLAKAMQKQLSNAAALRLRSNANKPNQHRALSPCKKVEEVLRVFKLVFRELDSDKLSRGGATGRLDYMTRTILVEMGMQVNSQKMIGPVPGVEVGLELQFKAELSLVGLHFDIMGGIDYMKKGNMELATSIVSSEGNDYGDRFDDDVMIYCGQGGNTTSKDPRVIRDQKLVTGNLALANSMREKSPVRVIRGKKRLDQRGKNYVYDGLYMVENYWRERGPQGFIMFKFKLCRIPGQPYVHL